MKNVKFQQLYFAKYFVQFQPTQQIPVTML